jgi:D-xylose transport system substrate-binding protein
MKENPVQRARSWSRTAGLMAVLSAVAVGGCGSDDDDGGGGGGGGGASNAEIAFLMPDTASTRYELSDKPLFEKRLKEICSGCSVLYQNADSDAAKQQQQVDSALAQGVKAIVLDPVDSAAAATMVQKAQSQNVPIIAYDRPIPKAKADYYVSFDNEKLGAMFAKSLVDKVKEENPGGGILQVNGSPTDAAAGLIKKGMHSSIDPSGLKLLAEFDTPDWAPPKAQDWVSGQITKFKGQIDGVVAANDGTAGGAIAAFKASGTPVPPVSGNDAELAAAQRIVKGDQYNTISKPIRSSPARRPTWRTPSRRARPRRARRRCSTPRRSCSCRWSSRRRTSRRSSSTAASSTRPRCARRSTPRAARSSASAPADMAVGLSSGRG